MIDKILDGLFTINSLIVGIILGFLTLDLFGFFEFQNNILFAFGIILLCYTVEGFLAVRRSDKLNIEGNR